MTYTYKNDIICRIQAFEQNPDFDLHDCDYMDIDVSGFNVYSNPNKDNRLGKGKGRKKGNGGLEKINISHRRAREYIRAVAEIFPQPSILMILVITCRLKRVNMPLNSFQVNNIFKNNVVTKKNLAKKKAKKAKKLNK